MFWNDVRNYYAAYPQWFLIGAAALVGAALIASLLLRHRRKTADERQAVKTIKGITATFLHNILVPDSLDGAIHVDFMLLTPGGILVLDVYRFTGLLFGGEQIDHWTQIIGDKSFKFNNPLRENYARVQAVRALVPGVPVQGRVVYSSAGKFPRRIPEGVSMIETLQDDVAHVYAGKEIPAEILTAWDRLAAQSQPRLKS